MASATNTLHSTTEAAKTKTTEAASTAAEKARETASSVADKARDVASTAAEKARQTASTLGHKAEDATHAMGSSMRSLGENIRDKGPHEGVMGSATSSLAGCLESTGQYLQHEGLKGIADDVTNLIRRNPIPALLLGVGLGFIVARATMRR